MAIRGDELDTDLAGDSDRDDTLAHLEDLRRTVPRGMYTSAEAASKLGIDESLLQNHGNLDDVTIPSGGTLHAFTWNDGAACYYAPSEVDLILEERAAAAAKPASSPVTGALDAGVAMVRNGGGTPDATTPPAS